MSQTTSDDDLPDEQTTFQIVPGTDAIETASLEDVFTQLRSTCEEHALEVRVVTRGAGVEYYVRAAEAKADAVARKLRRAFPSSTRIERMTPPELELPGEPAAGMRVVAHGRRRGDWQTGLQSIDNGDEASFPLASVVETLADADSMVVFQAVLTSKPSWEYQAVDRKVILEDNLDTIGQQITDTLFYDNGESRETISTNQARIDAIEDMDTAQSFSVNVRAIADGPDAASTLRELEPAFTPLNGKFYTLLTSVTTDSGETSEIADHVRAATCRRKPSLAKRVAQRLPITPNESPEIVAGPAVASQFCLLDGDDLTSAGQQAVQATPAERTGVELPDSEILSRYDGDGMLLGRPLDVDRTTLDQRVSLPPSLQPLHTAWIGKTGSGKTTALSNAILLNHYATEGASILFDSKGDGMPIEYLMAHYAAYDTLENVYYFDCAEVLPAISFFDIREQLEAGIPHTTAVENIADHYLEILKGLSHADNFESSIRSKDVIKFLVKALFDPTQREMSYRHRDLLEETARMQRTGEAPAVSNRSAANLGDQISEASNQMFKDIMQGAVTRMDKIRLDDRLDLLFNHVPEDENDASFDFREVIDENAVVIFDTGGLREQSQGAITRVLLSKLWTALQRRTRESHGPLDELGGSTPSEDGEAADLPLVNVYLEEAASLTTSSLLSELLAQSRSFGLSMTLAMQYPQQFKADSEAAYNEVLNNISTIVTGNVSVDRKLARTLATPDMSATAVENRLGALRRGEWLVSLPASFGEPEPRPFIVESEEMPPGHPDSDAPLPEMLRVPFQDALDGVHDRSREEYGLDIEWLLNQDRMTIPDGDADSDAAAHGGKSGPSGYDPDARTDSALPYTTRIPDGVSYDADSHTLACQCGSQFDPTSEGIRAAIACCGDLEDIDRDNVPICELTVTMSDDERRQTRCTDAQLRFLHAVYAAQQQRFDPDLEYSLLHDSMYRLREYVDLSKTELTKLIDWDLLWQDCMHPHTLYTVSPEGRAVANIHRRDDFAHGDGEGDIHESSLHVAMVQLAVRYIQQEYVADDASEVVEALAYHDVDDIRLDAAGLDEHGEIVVTAEAERSNEARRRRAPEDYDKMAGHDPEAAIWVVPTGKSGHEILDALNDPLDGECRIEKTYSNNTPTQNFQIDEPGFTEMFTFGRLRDTILED